MTGLCDLSGDFDVRGDRPPPGHKRWRGRGRRVLEDFGAATRAWIGGASYLRKWLALGLAIGVIAGLGAIVFYKALSFATQVLTGALMGYTAPSPAGEPGGPVSAAFPHPWVVPLVVAAGGLVSGILVYRLAPEAEGHGTDAAIDAIHTDPRSIRGRAVVVKLVASAITIGSGGSGGREGPTAQIAAGFGSMLARLLNLSEKDGRIAVAVGIGSGVGAIFRAPLGGAVTSADIVYRDDFEGKALVPGFIASVTSFTIFGLAEGFDPVFGYIGTDYRFEPRELAWYAVIGVLCGLIGILYSGTFYRITELARRVRGPRAIRPAIGGLCVGLLAVAVPQVLGTGYGWVQHALNAEQLLDMSLWVVLAIPFAKILATSLSIGTGGSGGVFGPGIVIGAFVGAAVWRLAEHVSVGAPADPAPFVIVGMVACFGAIARAPLAMMLMVAEMTGSLTILGPAMLSTGIAYLITRHSGQTIYRSQLRDREEAAARRMGTAGSPVADPDPGPLPDGGPSADRART